MACSTGIAAAQLVLLLLLLLGASTAQEQPVPQMLTDQPNCKLPPKPVPGVLPAGVVPVAEAQDGTIAKGGDAGCTIALPQLAVGETHLYQFGVLPASEMSLIVVLRARGGTALMDLFLPSSSGGPGDVGGGAGIVATASRDSAASSESWLAVSPQQLADNPGLYTLRLRGESGSPTVEVTVATPGSGLQLDARELAAMAAVAKRCCGSANAKAPFCTTIAPAALAPKHAWPSDLCHTPPNLCDAEGHLLSLSLRDAGLKCSTFPKELSQLGSLARLDLSGNELQADVKDVAAVLSQLPVRELYLSNTRLGGPLDCSIITPLRKVYELSSNFISGTVPACMLSSPVEELYLGRNELSGTLPLDSYQKSTLIALALGNQRRPKGGLSGPVPPGLLALDSLLFVNLAGNNFSGRLAAVPPNAIVFNVSACNLEGTLPPLPENLWVTDLSANSFSGAVPPLARLPRLEAFLAGGNAFEGPLPELPPALAVLDASYNRLAGSLPALPPALVVMDVSSNLGLSGDISGLQVGQLAELRLGNNSFTGGVPASATKSRTLTMLSLRVNKLAGAIPADWDTPLLEMLLLSDNSLTGTVPPALARQPQLGTLRLEGNQLGGSLEAFAAALPDPAGPDHASQLFHFDASRNALQGPLPSAMQRLGVFSSDQQFVMVTPAGQVPFARILNVSENQLAGPWPGWLLSAVPQARGACNCPITVKLSGRDMRLACPRSVANVTDYYWQIAAQMGYTCWEGRSQAPLTDYLESPNNAASPSDTQGPVFGDSAPAPPPLTPGGSAGVGIAVVFGTLGLAALAYFVGYKRLWQEHRAKKFERFQDGGGGAGGGGSAHLTHADAAAVAAAVEGVAPASRS